MKNIHQKFALLQSPELCRIKRRIAIAGLSVIAAATTLTGCQALNTLAGNTASKNIAAGSDTWGGDIEASLTGTAESAPLSVSMWFGRRRVWYVSSKDGTCKDLAEVVKASNSALTISAGATGISVGQGK